jgi:hypothetical protein
MWQLKTAIFLHWGLIRAVPLSQLLEMMSGDSCKVVKYSPHHPKVKGLSPSTAVQKDGRENGWKVN